MILADAETFYQENVVPSGLFEQVYEHYPHYNTWQSCEATDWIMSQLDDKYEDATGWEDIRGEICDKVLAGLT